MSGKIKRTRTRYFVSPDKRALAAATGFIALGMGIVVGVGLAVVTKVQETKTFTEEDMDWEEGQTTRYETEENVAHPDYVREETTRESGLGKG